MRKILIIGMCLMMAMFSCTKDDDAPKKVLAESITIENGDIVLNENDVTKVITKVLPLETTNKEIKFESEDNEIASVSKTGVITGKSLGVTKISASIDGAVTQIQVTVKSTFEAPESLIGNWIGIKFELIDKNGTCHDEEGVRLGWLNSDGETKEEQDAILLGLRNRYGYSVEAPNKIRFGLLMDMKDDGTSKEYLWGDGTLNYKRGNKSILVAKFNLEDFDIDMEGGGKWDRRPFNQQEMTIEEDGTIRVQTKMGENQYVCYYRVEK